VAKTYNPREVIVTFRGVPLSGFTDGTFIEGSRNNPSWNTSVGADGEGVRAKSNDKSGTVTLTLLQSSASNLSLATLAQLDELAGEGSGQLEVVDLSGTTVMSAADAWIQQPADISFGQEKEDRVWVFETDDLFMLHGGN